MSLSQLPGQSLPRVRVTDTTPLGTQWSFSLLSRHRSPTNRHRRGVGTVRGARTQEVSWEPFLSVADLQSSTQCRVSTKSRTERRGVDTSWSTGRRRVSTSQDIKSLGKPQIALLFRCVDQYTYRTTMRHATATPCHSDLSETCLGEIVNIKSSY